jgi:hypothetical protein
MRKAGVIVAAFLIVTSGLATAAELTPRALDAWDRYVRQADEQVKARVDVGHPFLSSDEIPARRARLQAGEIVALPGDGAGAHSVPDGLIHDWFGEMFIPNAKLEDVLAVVHDYDHYKEYYRPTVADSKTLVRTQSAQKFSMLWRRKVLFVDAALQGQYESRDFAVDERRQYSIAASTRVQEVENYGEQAEHLLPPDQGNGFLWRVHSIARYQERDGGVYVELEAIGLTRNIPLSLRWLVKPLVARLARDSVTTSLQQTREAVMLRPEVASRLRGVGGSTPMGDQVMAQQQIVKIGPEFRQERAETDAGYVHSVAGRNGAQPAIPRRIVEVGKPGA